MGRPHPGSGRAISSSDHSDCTSRDERVSDLGGERHRPRRVDPPAERGEDADAPVADLVAEPLDDDRAVGRQGGEVRSCSRRNCSRFRCRERIEVVVALASCFMARASDSAASSREAAPIRAPSSTACPTPSPFQKGTAPGTPGAGDASTRSRVISSILHVEAPSMNVWPLTGFVDHLLVELADPSAAVDLEDPEKPAIRDRARVRDREPASARSGPRITPAVPVPHDPRPQLRELVGRIAPREHVEDVVELLPGEVGERMGRRRTSVEQLVDRDLLSSAQIATTCCARTSSGLRGIAISSIAPARIAFATTAHSREVGAELREDLGPSEVAPRPCPARPTRCRPSRDRLRALDLDHEVDRAHVDAELEARGRDEAWDPARLEVFH